MEYIKEEILKEYCREYCKKKCPNPNLAADRCDIISFDAWVQVKKLGDDESLWGLRQKIAKELYKL